MPTELRTEIFIWLLIIFTVFLLQADQTYFRL